MNKDNKVYAAEINKPINNNKKSFSTLDKIEEEIIDKTDNRNVNQKINDIFNSRQYIYKADVVIYLEKETVKKRVIGRNSKYLITDKNELIPIDEIKNIKYQ